MSLLSETLVDEWLNRQGFLTMRGIKNSGVDEVDLLGVRPADRAFEAWHVEAQISYNPIGYITGLSRAEQQRNGSMTSNIKQRSEAVLRASVEEWVHKKFTSTKKQVLRERVWPGLSWQNVLVHGNVRHQEELDLLSERGVRLVSFQTVLEDLVHKKGLTGASGTDISDIIRYFSKDRSRNPTPSSRQRSST